MEGAREQSRGIGRISSRTAAWLAWALAALTVVLVCCELAFAILYRESLDELPFLVGVVVSALVGAVVASRRPRNPIGWFFILSSASFAIATAMLRYAIYGLVTAPDSLPLAHAMAWPHFWVWVPGLALVLIFVPLYFPHGRLLSPRWRPVLWLALFASVTQAVFWAFAPGATSGVTNPLGIEALRPVAGALGDFVTGLLFLVLFLASVVSLVVRFWRSRGEERQQMKWITYAAGIMFTLVLLVTALDLVAANSALAKVANPLTGAMFAGIPVAVGIAVLKYHLYEIDLLINRTLVYGALTALLAAGYVATIMALQGISYLVVQAPFRAFLGQESALATVAATLAMAALFNPLRRRIQSFIDRRFYRSKYDAAKTLEGLSKKLRDETDLEALSGDLVGAVRETMQPAHVSLWLRTDTASKGKALVGSPRRSSS